MLVNIHGAYMLGGHRMPVARRSYFLANDWGEKNHVGRIEMH